MRGKDGRSSLRLTLCLAFMCLPGSPSPVQADELATHLRSQVIGRDRPGQCDDSAHLGKVLGTVRTARQVRFETSALPRRKSALEIAGDKLHCLLANQGPPQ